MSVSDSRAGSWLKRGKSDQWINQVRCCSWASGLLNRRVSICSLILLISSMALSQLTDRISQASLPQVASRSLSLSVVCSHYQHTYLDFLDKVMQRTSTRKRYSSSAACG